MLDRRTFLGVMTVFSDMLSRPPLSEPSLEFYYDSIKDMETDAFTKRATEIIRGRKYTTLPTPADFLNLPDDQDEGMLAAEGVLRLMESLGGDQDLHGQESTILMALEALGGWVACCDAVSEYDIDKLGIWKRDFAAVYKACKRRDQSKAPKVLYGRHSQSNISRGYLNPATGELRNLLGEIVCVKPWGGKVLSDGKRDVKLLDVKSLPIEDLTGMLKELREGFEMEGGENQ